MGEYTSFGIMAMFALCTVCLGREPSCSRYHYEEQILSKVLRLEHRLDLLEDAKALMNTRCPDTWITFQGSCYIFINEKVTYEHARIQCASLGAHLVKVNSENENAFISMYLDKLKDNHYWIGLSDIKTEGQFQWDGETTATSFTNWIPGQPDNSNGKEDCVRTHYSYDHRWNDGQCIKSFMFICEK